MTRRVAPKHFTLAERLDFHSMPEPNSGCQIWLAATDEDGYGFITRDGRQTRAHRAAYELEHGAIASGLVVDHLCRTPTCINHRHLEAVTVRVNTMRGISPTAQNAEKVFCKHGHLLAGVTARTGWRECRVCHRARTNEARRRNPPVRDYAAEYAARLASRLRASLNTGKG